VPAPKNRKANNRPLRLGWQRRLPISGHNGRTRTNCGRFAIPRTPSGAGQVDSLVESVKGGVKLDPPGPAGWGLDRKSIANRMVAFGIELERPVVGVAKFAVRPEQGAVLGS